MSIFSSDRRVDCGSSACDLNVSGAGYSAMGTRHFVNQDRYLADNQRRVYMVADGMGGMRGGERAAQLAIELLPTHPALLALERPAHREMQEAIAQSFLDVNMEIVTSGRLDPRLTGLGTTAVLAVLVQGTLFIGSLGDSRAYLWRDGRLHQYTVDHNMAQALVSMGVISRSAAQSHRWRHMLWKYLGCADLHEGPEVNAIRLAPGDRVVLVTDGVTEVLTRDELTALTARYTTPPATARALVDAAVARGARDDATAVALHANMAE